MDKMVLGVGQCCMDYFALSDGFPRENTKQEAIELAIEGGGQVATALVSLARLGVGARMVGIVSDDRDGTEIIERFKKEGVSTEFIVVRGGGISQRSFIIVNRQTGTRTILWQKPTVGVLTEEDIKEDAFSGVDFLLVDGYMKEATLKALSIARRLGIPTMIDADRMYPDMEELLPLIDYIVGSEDFSRHIDAEPIMALEKLSANYRHARTITITLGTRGSITLYEGRLIEQPAFVVEDVVDTTGAGDVFHGGYIYGLLSGWEIEDTLRFASAFAALKCRSLSGRRGIPTLEETLRFMKTAALRNPVDSPL